MACSGAPTEIADRATHGDGSHGISQLVWLDDRFGWHAKLAMETPGHFHRQAALSVEDLGHSGARTKQRYQIRARDSSLLHEVLERCDRIRGLDRVVSRF